MSASTSIQWTDRTWNPVRGCSRVSAGCDNCYAMRQARRFDAPGGAYEGLTRIGKRGVDWSGVVRLVPETLDEPLRWRRPCRIFVNSMSDLFHESLPDEAIDRVFAVMAWARRHTYQILTKRAQRLHAYGQGLAALGPEQRAMRMVASMYRGHPAERLVTGAHVTAGSGFSWPLPNVWMLVSVEDQATADLRIPLLLQTPAAVRGISLEPQLAHVDLDGGIYDGPGWLRGWHTEPRHASGCDGSCSAGRCPEPVETQNARLDWVIQGGESGPGARPFDLTWARSVRDQCRAAGVAYFLKQIGARPIDSDPRDIVCNGKVHYVRPAADSMCHEASITPGYSIVPHDVGRLLRDRKGGDMSEWPEDLRVREFPRS